jgi:penicillin amidase
VRQNFDIFQRRPRDAVILDPLDDTVHVLQARLGDDLAHWRAPTVPLTFRANNFFGVQQANSAEAITLSDYMNRGTENDLVVFDALGAHGRTLAWDVVAPGESGFIAPDGKPSQHYADQVDLYGSFGKKPLMFDKADVARRTKSVEQLRLSRVN